MLEKMLASLPDVEATKNVAIALSGGLDSTTLVHLLVLKYGADRVKTLSFDYGQRHLIELEMAEITATNLGVYHQCIKLPHLQEIAKDVCSLIADSDLKPKTAEENAGNPQVNTYVPFRNMQFASIQAAFAEAHNCSIVFQGLNAVDFYGYFDTSEEFVARINAVLELNRMNPIKFLTPFVRLYKVDELILAKEMFSIYGDFLQFTWSCYNGVCDTSFKARECGHCSTCSEKVTGYIKAKFTDDEILSKFQLTMAELDDLRTEIE